MSLFSYTNVHIGEKNDPIDRKNAAIFDEMQLCIGDQNTPC